MKPPGGQTVRRPRTGCSRSSARRPSTRRHTPPISTSKYSDTYWALAQLVAHQTSDGSNLCPADLLGSGTLSGPAADSLGCLLELTAGGKRPLELPGGERRAFLHDGDRVVMTGWYEAPGRARISPRHPVPARPADRR
ncbi:MAG: fumarylacetoacetate hydrolase family protein [Lautropia sp.]